MNPYGIGTRQPLDTKAITEVWHAGRRARSNYYGEDAKPCGCSSRATCRYHRSLATADLRVATSEEECEHLLTVIDRPSPPCADPDCDRVRDGRHRLCWTCRKDRR